MRASHENMKLKKILIKIKAEKNWAVDKMQQKAKQEAEWSKKEIQRPRKRFFEGRLIGPPAL